MNYDVIFLLEESSLENVLKEILPKIIPDEISFICIPHQGKQDLAKSIPKKIRAFQFNPATKFVIVQNDNIVAVTDKDMPEMDVTGFEPVTSTMST